MTVRAKSPQLPLGLPPRRRRVLMQVVDAGNFPDGGPAVCLRCRVCGHETGWVPGRAVSADRRGRPCPQCSPRPERAA